MTAPSQDPQDVELQSIVEAEQSSLGRIVDHLESRAREQRKTTPETDYESQMLALRDEIAVARTEDVPPLLEQMERLQALAAHRGKSTKGFVDIRSPYFGRMLLKEGERQREVMIGRSTYLDTQSGIRIVDWRDAPVSRLYYRYEEGDDYDEEFGGREVYGEVVLKRRVNIIDGRLTRIGCPQGVFARNAQDKWRRLDDKSMLLRGGQGSATRAESQRAPGKLGIGADAGEDKHLKEITALIDRRQFDLITRSDSGLVVIQGGAGSGKTTIGLHRMAYLAYRDPRRFRAHRMLVVVFNKALVRYIAQVLPALGVSGTAIRTYQEWASRVRSVQVRGLPKRYSEETPAEVSRLKKHPKMLKTIDAYVAEIAGGMKNALADIHPALGVAFEKQKARPLAHRVHSVNASIRDRRLSGVDRASALRGQSLCRRFFEQARDVVSAWADLLTDKGRIYQEFATEGFSETELARIVDWNTRVCSRAIAHLEDDRERHASGTKRRKESEVRAADGYEVEDHAELDFEDDTLVLRLCQRMRGPLRRSAGNKEALIYEHVLIDEAQDLSPVELAVVLNTVSKAESVTLAGDVAQRLNMDNGFSDWETVLSELGRAHVEIEPLKLSYRSTAPIIDFSRQVLGHLADRHAPEATRGGAEVELFRFAHTGDAVGFLAEALRDLLAAEPRASVAVITRFPEQADLYYAGLRKGEVPNLRRVADQDFPFKPGVDVTDIRQVKGLEFDYVILGEVTHSSFPADDEARHLLHIASTRAAHQLWVISTGKPSQLLPQELQDRSV